ncbi:3-hydroxyacyl-ACP dehydratase FabZ family protein [Goodfellowiella coeruleoviolacea]|uniref:3-hydroxyacyl-[acyl-carrier-protein] dehydratase n=1 Tax=Goodfellowiella coeruleoviolacea TaxID=334858 RepID=A0AAE3G964_9PSEU|nr:3-hydroxyacyl-ACP dehydratase [Goodfellowiella coeruleoviolacea]MCP2163194.1 3-hydroxyacyl-[acyl-carrier-protein] dehydratase [Goodfellowiella coeruleoviolacea]
MIDVADILPHRYPMLLVDRVLDIEPGRRVTAVKAITRNEPWYADAAAVSSSDGAAYPPALLVESWAQAAGLVFGIEQPNPDVLAGRVMLLGSLSDVEFHRPVLPGDVLEHRVRVARAVGETVIFEGECVVGGELVFTVSRMVVAYRPAGVLREAGGEQRT